MHELGSITRTLEEFGQYAATRRVIPVRTTVLAALGLPLLLAIVSEGARRPEAAPARAADRAALAQDKAR